MTGAPPQGGAGGTSRLNPRDVCHFNSGTGKGEVWGLNFLSMEEGERHVNVITSARNDIYPLPKWLSNQRGDGVTFERKTTLWSKLTGRV